MANDKLFSLEDLKIPTSRNSFDLSNKVGFTAKIGELLPFYTKWLITGDKVKLDASFFTRMVPLTSPAFTRIRQYIDFYFVPAHLICKSLGSVFTNMTNNPVQAKSFTENLQVGKYLPSYRLSDLVGYKGTAGYKSALSSLLTTDNKQPNIPEGTPESIGVDSADNARVNYFGFNRGILSAKLMTYLKYSRITPSDAAGVNGRTGAPDEGGTFFADIPVNMMPLFAYQKIYCDHFRNDQWERAEPYTYNADYFDTTKQFLDDLPDYNHAYWKSNTPFDLRYCNFPLDIFMGIKPNTQLGDTAIVTTQSLQQSLQANSTIKFPSRALDLNINSSGNPQGKISVVDGLASFETTSGIKQGMIIQSQTPVSGSGNIYAYDSARNVTADIKIPVSDLQGTFNILALRSAEFVQRWREVAQTGDQDLKAQTLKQFGVNIPSYFANLSIYIGGSAQNININEVTNNNLAGDDNDTVQKGVAQGTGNFSKTFTADCHGILMGIYHAVPLLDYDLNNIDHTVAMTEASDFAQPAFDKIGMEELPYYELTNDYNFWHTHWKGSGSAVASTAFGYVPRYAQWKSSIDYVTGAFTTIYNNWVCAVDENFLSLMFGGKDVSISTWSNPVNFNFFKVNPSILDSITKVNASSSWDTDTFLVNMYVDCKKATNLDYNGMPY